MKDFRGVELNIGDTVVTDSPHYKGMLLAKVVAFTPKMIRVELLTTNNYYYKVGSKLLREHSAVAKLG